MTCVKYWSISHFDKRFTVVDYIYIYIYQITDYHWYCRVIKEHWPRVWCVIALKTESRHDAKFIITGCYCGAHSDDKIGIVTTVDFIYSWSSEHQNYDCKILPLVTFSCKWMSFVSPFLYTSSDDRHVAQLQLTITIIYIATIIVTISSIQYTSMIWEKSIHNVFLLLNISNKWEIAIKYWKLGKICNKKQHCIIIIKLFLNRIGFS